MTRTRVPSTVELGTPELRAYFYKSFAYEDITLALHFPDGMILRLSVPEGRGVFNERGFATALIIESAEEEAALELQFTPIEDERGTRLSEWAMPHEKEAVKQFLHRLRDFPIIGLEFGWGRTEFLASMIGRKLRDF